MRRKIIWNNFVINDVPKESLPFPVHDDTDAGGHQGMVLWYRWNSILFKPRSMKIIL